MLVVQLFVRGSTEIKEGIDNKWKRKKKSSLRRQAIVKNGDHNRLELLSPSSRGTPQEIDSKMNMFTITLVSSIESISVN